MPIAPTFVASAAMPVSLSPRPLWFVVRDNGIVLRLEDEGDRDGVGDDLGHRGGEDRAAGATTGLRLPTTSEVAALGIDLTTAHHLGHWQDRDQDRDKDRLGQPQDCLAVDGAPGASDVPPRALAPVPPPWRAEGLRGLHGRLDDGRFALAGRAMQMVHFASRHRFCGRCAAPTRRDPDAHVLRCSRCQAAFYPRISPAVIVLVRHGRQALLARAARSTSGFYSTLAGFVAPGESLEETVAREVREEVGIEIRGLRYFGSQPWPFPDSLMIGFVAEYAGGQLAPDGHEILDAAWFAPEALPPVPPKISIARHLIDAWVAEVTDAR
jgi:NAD+ diphosphatase